MGRLTHATLAISVVVAGCAGAEGLSGGNQDTSVISTTVGTPNGTDSNDDAVTGGDTDGMTSISTTDPSDTDPSDSDPSDTDASDTDPSDTDPSDTDGPEPGCGNAIVEAGEQCDLGEANADTGPCKADCTNQVCGDGFVGPGEACDDANVVDDDACSNACLLTSCGDGAVNGGVEQCDDGNGDDGDACPGTCLNATCGDGFVHNGVEVCDEGAATAGCDADCTQVSCGDGTANAAAGESCDDGNGDQGDGCPSCQNAFCGDGFVQSGVESCDDGNGNSGDGCSSQCQFEFPDVCEAGADPGTGSPWVVCAADQNSAWVSANNGGNYHPVEICQQLGYSTVGQWGGTCGNVCGYCQGPTACDATGSQVFDAGAWNGVGNCGADGLGQVMCFTVMWTCVN